MEADASGVEADAEGASAVVPLDEQAASSDAVRRTGTTSKDLRIPFIVDVLRTVAR
jgi:hypothetical protein